MRVTTNTMVRNYSSSLSSTLKTLNTSRTRLETRRKFMYASEDPAAASRASSLTKKYLDIEDNLTTVENAMSRQDSADSTIQQIITMVKNASADEGLKGVNGATSEEAKKTHAVALRQMQQSMLQLANSQYGGTYLFAGTDGGNPPLALDGNGKVTFRGVYVSSTDPEDIKILEEMANEKLYLDVGMGLQFLNGKTQASSYKDINGATAYDMSFSGLPLLGFGPPNGNPPISQNAIELVGQLADALESPDFDQQQFMKLYDQLKDCHSTMTDYDANVGVKKVFLETTKERLETDKLNIYAQLDSVANINPADAIMDYSYSQYAYNMVLKVGNSLLSNSFIDFMK